LKGSENKYNREELGEVRDILMGRKKVEEEE